MWDHIKLALLYLVPKKALTACAGWVASKKMGKITKMLIELFIWRYHVDMSEAKEPNPKNYSTFNDFFARALNDDARPIDFDANTLVMPADGTISQAGHIEDEMIFQAKGHDYTLEALLAGDWQMQECFKNGEFITTYLSPRDYHRVHMPCDAVLREMFYVPGDLFSVSPLTTRHIPNLFARNERVICYFETEIGPMAQILIGSTIVGSIEMPWTGVVTPPREGIIRRWEWPEQNEQDSIRLKKGEQMGCFKMGSTVITLFPAEKITLSPHVKAGSKVQFGQSMAKALAK